jgi:tRNA 2-thiouridine synthesizing protein A
MTLGIDKTLDTCGLICPEPVMMLHKAMRELASGQIVDVLATDPSTQRDIPKFCHFLGHDLVMQDVRDKLYIYRIKKS